MGWRFFATKGSLVSIFYAGGDGGGGARLVNFFSSSPRLKKSEKIFQVNGSGAATFRGTKCRVSLGQMQGNVGGGRPAGSSVWGPGLVREAGAFFYFGG